MFDPFVNYARSTERTTPINLSAARVILGSYLIWKILSLHWGTIAEWPVPVYQRPDPFLLPELSVPFLGIEKWILTVALLGFVVGYHTRLASFVSAVLLCHMAGLRLPYNPSGGTEAMFLAAFFLLFFGLYAEQDRLSVDSFKATASTSLTKLNSILRDDQTRAYRMSALRWCLLVLAVLYFGAGIQKVLLNPDFSWTQPESLARYMTMNSFADHEYRPVAELFSSSKLLLSGLSWSTLVLEIGLLIAVLAGVTITPFVIGLIGFHVGIALALDPFFFDFIVFLCLFTAFDSVLGLLTWRHPITIVYDNQSRWSVRRLIPFKLLDVNDELTFVPFASAGNYYVDEMETSLVVVIDGERYAGYDGFLELLHSCRLFTPITLALRLNRINERVRERYWEAVSDTAEHASRNFAKKN